MNRAVGAVLEADGTGEAGCQLAVDLAFGRARADRAPTDEIANVLRGNGVQVLSAAADAELHNVPQQRSGRLEASVDVVGVVHVGVVDQPLPADGGARLLEIDAHDDVQVVAMLLRLLAQPFGVFEARLGVVNGAGSDDHQQPLVAAVDDVADRAPIVEHPFRGPRRHRQFVDEAGRGGHLLHAGDAGVVGQVLHGSLWLKRDGCGMLAES